MVTQAQSAEEVSEAADDRLQFGPQILGLVFLQTTSDQQVRRPP